MPHSWLITGAGGQFGSVLLRGLVQQGRQAVGVVSPTGVEPFVGETRRVDITDRDRLADVVRALRPDIIVHAAAVTAIEAAYRDPAKAERTNVVATEQLAELAQEVGARLVFISTDLVFDGTCPPYDEQSAPRPLSVYGRSKAEAEQVVRRYERAIVIRPPLMYGLPAAPRETTFTRQLADIRRGAELRLFEDEFRTPLSLIDAARAVERAAVSDLTGVLHIGGPQRLSRLNMGRIAARALGYPDAGIIPVRQADMAFAEPRPADLSLVSGRFAECFGEPPGRAMAEAMKETAAEFLRR